MDRGSWRIAVLFAAAALGGTYLGGADGLRFCIFRLMGHTGNLIGQWGLGVAQLPNPDSQSSSRFSFAS